MRRRSINTKGSRNDEYSIGSRLFRADEDGGFVVGNVSEGDSQTPTAEKPESATLFSGASRRAKSGKSGQNSGGLPEYDRQDDAWDASDIKTPLLGSSTVFASSSSHTISLHAATSPAMIDTHSAALWLAATRANSLPGKELVVSRPVYKMRAREESGSSSTYVPTPLFDDGMHVPEPPFDYEVSMLCEAQEREGVAR